MQIDSWVLLKLHNFRKGPHRPISDAAFDVGDTNWDSGLKTDADIDRRVASLRVQVKNSARILDIDGTLQGRLPFKIREPALNSMVKMGCVETVQLLLNNARLDLNRQSGFNSALFIATSFGHGQIVDMLLAVTELEVDDQTIFQVFSSGQSDFLRRTISSGKIDPKTWRSKEQELTLLHASIIFNVTSDLPMLDLTIDYAKSSGLDPNVRDASGYTALHYAVKHALSLRIVQQLVNSFGEGIDLEASTSGGDTPLDLAMRERASFRYHGWFWEPYDAIVSFLDRKIAERNAAEL